MRILLPAQGRKGKNNWFWEIFRSNLGRFHDVIYYGPEYLIHYDPGIPLSEVCKLYQPPDLILVHLPQEKHILSDLHKITHIPKVYIMGDYAGLHSNHIGRYREDHKCHVFLNKYNFDMIFTHDKFVYYKLKERYPMFHIPFCVDTSVYYNKKLERDFDVAAMYAAKEKIYPDRRKVQNLIRKMVKEKHVNKLKNGHRTVRWDYIEYLNRAKIFVNNHKDWHIMGVKVFEATACGAMFLTDRIDFMDEYGYIDGEHLVVYKNFNDIEEKIKYYLKHDDEREKIAKAGMKYTVENYNMDKVIKNFTDEIERNI